MSIDNLKFFEKFLGWKFGEACNFKVTAAVVLWWALFMVGAVLKLCMCVCDERAKASYIVKIAASDFSEPPMQIA